MVKTIQILVSGKVQGVYYRQSTKETAQRLAVSGTVKNLLNGDVLIIATGTDEHLQQLIQWCKKGPARAEVHTVEVSTLELKMFERFSIERNV